MLSLKALRKERSLTQSQLADKLGVSQSNIAEWESGKKNPNLESLIALSDFFSVSIDFLLGRTHQNISNKDIKNTKENNSAYVQELLNNFNSLSTKNQIKLLAFSQDLVDEEHSVSSRGKLSTSQIS